MSLRRPDLLGKNKKYESAPQPCVALGNLAFKDVRKTGKLQNYSSPGKLVSVRRYTAAAIQ